LDLIRSCTFAVFILATSNAIAGDLPDPKITPGAINESLTADEFLKECHQSGWTRLYRPPTSYTNGLKRIQMKQYGYASSDKSDFEEDHLIPLCLGGASQDPHNLWPQPRVGEWNAERKDKLERKLCTLACQGRIPLRQAQHDIATDWIAAYMKYVHSK
jgi:hypothetical protein